MCVYIYIYDISNLRVNLKVFGVCGRAVCAAAASCLLANVTCESDLLTVFVNCWQVVAVSSHGVLHTCVEFP